MKNIAMMGSVAVLSLGLMMSAACSDDDTSGTGGNGGTGNVGNNGGDGGTTDGGGGTGGDGGGGMMNIEVPTLGAQIDRKGRPAINTATINTFDLVAGDPDQARSDAEAEYNANADPSTWAADYASTVAAALAIYDSLADSAADGACGDQLFYNFGATDNGAMMDGYMTLATVLASDWLVIDSTQATSTCGYLGVESTLLGGDASCGGRMPGEDVMDATYQVLAPADGFGDEIDAPAAAPLNAFPYLASPDDNVDG